MLCTVVNSIQLTSLSCQLFFFLSVCVQMVWIREENKIRHIGWRSPAVMDSCENPLRFLPAEVHSATAGTPQRVSSFLSSFLLRLYAPFSGWAQSHCWTWGAVFHVDILKSRFHSLFHTITNCETPHFEEKEVLPAIHLIVTLESSSFFFCNQA